MKKSWVAYPYVVWMIMFIVVPLILIIFYGTVRTTPQGMEFTLEHFKRFFEPLYIMVLVRSLYLAFICTIVCLLLGYPVSMILASKEYRDKKILIFLMVIPMWMNFLLRTYAWLTLLEKNGIINTLISFIGLPKMDLLYNQWAVVLGMVYNFLPFMVLPIYSVLIKIDKSIIEAAEDLGANSRTVFRKVIFPLSLPGVVSGITMVFMPAVTTFVISRLLGGGQFLLIGNLIEELFLKSGEWGFGSALSIIMMILILFSMAIMSRYEKENEGGGLL
ncbi:MAG: ABC transporter permease [Clostridiales bacterium]|jgi:spermidine/putrescine transport system permease protein|nr:ABC transporter permease [Clostridiales bacterium]